MKRDLKVYLDDILESIERIEEYTGRIAKDDFLQNVQIQDAVVRRLEIIGEAAKNVPSIFRDAHSDIPWKRIAGLRDVLAHEYFGVDLSRTWKVIKTDIPDLKGKVSILRDALA